MTTKTYDSAIPSTAISDQRQTLLRRALLGNTIFSAGCALAFFFGSGAIAEFLGIHDVMVFDLINGSSFILFLGLGLAIWAVDLLFVATRPTLNPKIAWGIFAADVAWVAVSWLLLMTGAIPFSDAGNWAVLILADIILMLAIVEAVGIRRMTR